MRSPFWLPSALLLALLLRPATAAAVDVGDTAIIQADASILEPGNPFPFGGRSLVFAPADGSYIVRTGPPDGGTDRGTRSRAYADQPAEVALPFPFPFFGKTYRRAYAYAHGVVLFGRPQRVDFREAPGALERQPPLIAALWHPAQFHPPLAAGVVDGIYVNAGLPDRVAITWFEVMPAQVESVLNTYQVVLARDGTIRIAYTDIQHPEGLVGLRSGRSGDRPAAVHLREVPAGGARGSFYELFRLPRYDPRRVAQAFYRDHPDAFDALAVFETFPLSHGAVASHLAVKNQVRGIGRPLFDQTREFGSQGRLESVLELNRLAFYPTDFASGMLAHELGHRWLASVSFMDGDRKSSDLLEGPGGMHWCFYVHTRAAGEREGRPLHSFAGGTMWEEPSPGRFLDGMSTVGGYAPLDLYLMGLLPPEKVPDLFYVTDRPDQRADCGISGNARTTGRRKVVSIGQIIAAEGPREPDVSRSPKSFRMAFVLLVPEGSKPGEADLLRMDRIRLAWESDFARYTQGLATMDTRLASGGEGAGGTGR